MCVYSTTVWTFKCMYEIWIFLFAMFKLVLVHCFDNVSSVFVLKWVCGRKQNNFPWGCMCVYVGEKFQLNRGSPLTVEFEIR